MNRPINFLVVFLCIAFSVAFIWDHVTQKMLLAPELIAPTKWSDSSLDGKAAWSLRFNETGQTTNIRIQFDILFQGSGKLQVVPATYKFGSDETGTISGLYLNNSSSEDTRVTELLNLVGPAKLSCIDTANKSSSIQTLRKAICTARVSVQNDTKIELITFGVESGNPDTAIISRARHLPFDQSKLVSAWLILLIVSPVIWVFHRFKRTSQWIILSVALALPLYLQPFYSLILYSILIVNYCVGRRVHSAMPGRYILFALTSSISLLFFLKSFKAVIGLPFESFGALAFVLPIGTSYIFIRLIDVQLRWYRGQQINISLREYLLYLLFPPTLLAGPIELIDKFYANRPDNLKFEFISYGFMRIIVGLFKKVVILDFMMANLLFESGLWTEVTTDPAGAGMKVVAFGLLTYMFAYIDLSSYSDIAIGTSRLFGYRILENFNWPILAHNLSEFWRRWHMSLSGWCFRNIYFPILMSTKAGYVAMLVTMATVGLWHELSLSWLTWGIFHGTGLAVLATLSRKKSKKITANTQCHALIVKLRKYIGIVLTNLFVAAGFAFVSVSDYRTAWEIFFYYLVAPINVLIG